MAKIQEVVDGYPGLTRDLLTYLQGTHQGGAQRREARRSSCASLDPDLEGSAKQAQDVATASRTFRASPNLKVEQQVLVPQIEVRAQTGGRCTVRPQLRRRSPRVDHATFAGTRLAKLYEDQKIFDVVVWGEADVRRDIHALSAS